MEKPQDKETIKKPYTAPQLFSYGDIREVTLANATGAKNDNSQGNNKTA